MTFEQAIEHKKRLENNLVSGSAENKIMILPRGKHDTQMYFNNLCYTENLIIDDNHAKSFSTDGNFKVAIVSGDFPYPQLEVLIL